MIHLFSAVAFVLLAVFVVPQSVCCQVTDTCIATKISGVEFYQTNYGVNGYNVKQYIAGLIWPRGSKNQYIFAGGLWIGGKILDNEELKPVVLITYNPITGKSWCDPTQPLVLTTNAGVETMTSTFTDTNLSSYEGDTAAHRASGFPMHLEINQTVTAWRSGSLKDVVTLTTVVHNTHPSRTIFELVIANVFDIDIGTPIAAINVGNGDKCIALTRRTDLGIHKAWSNPENDGTKVGVIGFAIINGPDPIGISTVSHEFVFFAPKTNEDRYAFISSGVLQNTTEGSDIFSAFGAAPLDVGPGESIQSTLVIMLGKYDDAANDDRMISIVDQLKNGTSVSDVATSPVPFRVYPNPVIGTTLINVVADPLPSYVAAVNTIGERTVLIVNPGRNIDISGLSSGLYTLVAIIDGSPIAFQISIVK